MDLVSLVIKQPVTVAVGVILTLIAGVLALSRIPVQLTPNVEDTIVSVRTFWEGASPYEIEQEVIDPQEEKLQGLTGLKHMTSTSTQSSGSIRLEFQVGIPKEEALRRVSDKLREVPDYPEHVDEPVVEASDPQNKDYIAWIVFSTTDPELDIRTMQDFAQDRIKPTIERMPGVSEVNVLGGREREVQIRFDPVKLAQRRITPSALVAAISSTNRNISAGRVADGSADVRIRTIGQYESVEQVASTIIAHVDGISVQLGDVANVVETYKEPVSFVRSKGRPVLAINVQREFGSNVMAVMAGVKRAVASMNQPGGLLEAEAAKRHLNGSLVLEQVYDQTVYIDQALALVKNNIWIGGALAVLVLLLFLRSLRSVGIIALAIPISIVGAFVVMVLMGRSINVISLAGMAFAVGMVVDNAIVVLENTFRHLEMGKSPMQAAHDGTREVWGAVLASTLTTIAVFIPILLIREEAGQLFRDIALAICAAVGLSLIVSITVIPAAAARVLRGRDADEQHHSWRPFRIVSYFPAAVAHMVYKASGSWLVRIVVVLVLTVGSIWGSSKLLPPADFLPTGNRNLIFGLVIPPPGLNINQQEAIAKRVEATMRPFWEAGELKQGTAEYAQAVSKLPSMVINPNGPQGPDAPRVVPPPLDNYFFVGFGTTMFHGGIASVDRRVADLEPLFAYATRMEVLPGVLAFARQVPLFRIGGQSSSSVTVDLMGDDLDEVIKTAGVVYTKLAQTYGYGSVRSNPSNFNLPGPELQIVPNRQRLAEVGMRPVDLGAAVQAAGDGAIIGEYRIGGESIDLKLIDAGSVNRISLAGIGDLPIATPSGHVVPLSSLAQIRRVQSPVQINRVDRKRAVSLELETPRGMPLEQAMAAVNKVVADGRQAGTIKPTIETGFTGSASKLKEVRRALLGDGTLMGLFGSSLFLALLVVYLLMCVLFQSFLTPMVIMFAVPPATLGGFLGLWLVHRQSVADRLMPIQNLDILTMLGVVLLIGVVVNNAILIVHQAINFMEGRGEGSGDTNAEKMPAREAIALSVRTRVRPIMMSTLTSVLGMLPLVVMPGSGSELYRGLGSVVIGGMLLSTIFTLFLVPMLFGLVQDIRAKCSAIFGRQGQQEVDMIMP